MNKRNALLAVLTAIPFAALFMTLMGDWQLSYSDFQLSSGARSWAQLPATYGSRDACKAAGYMLVRDSDRNAVTACTPAWLPADLVLSLAD